MPHGPMSHSSNLVYRVKKQNQSPVYHQKVIKGKGMCKASEIKIPPSGHACILLFFDKKRFGSIDAQQWSDERHICRWEDQALEWTRLWHNQCIKIVSCLALGS